MIVSNKYKFIFFCPTGNCGTTAIYKALLNLHDEKFIKKRYEANFTHPLNEAYKKKQKQYEEDPQVILVEKHIRPEIFFKHHAELKEKYNEYTKIAVARNPWDWALSMYNKNLTQKPLKEPDSFTKEKCQAFIKWVLNISTFEKTQYHNTKVNGKQIINKFLRFENLENDFQNFLKQKNIPEIKLTKEQVNKNPGHKNYRDFYSSASAHLVDISFQEDVVQFKYKY